MPFFYLINLNTGIGKQMKFNKIKEPSSGEKISYIDGVLNVPDNPIIP